VPNKDLNDVMLYIIPRVVIVAAIICLLGAFFLGGCVR